MMTPSEGKSIFSNYREKDFRAHQEEAIQWASDSKKRFSFLDAPTGAGKSLIGMTILSMHQKGVYLCGSIQLQNQIVDDFPEMKSLYGRSNYPCVLNHDKDCSQCVSTKQNPCAYKPTCEYKVEKERTINSAIKTLNYSYFLTEANAVGKFSDQGIIVIDEADHLENTLINHISLTFSERSLHRLGLTEGPARKTSTSQLGIAPWIEFGQEAMKRAAQLASDLNKEISTWKIVAEDWQISKIRERDYFTNLMESAKMFVENVDGSWLMEEMERRGSNQGKLIFRPIWITPKLAEKFLWSHAKKWVLQSASFLPLNIECHRLGIDVDEAGFKSIPSTFATKSRKIHITPVVNLTAKTTEEETPKLLKEIGRIVDLPRNRNVKGLIHAVSYKLAGIICDGMNDSRFITHTSQDKGDVLGEFIMTDQPKILVSPSMERGVSFDGDKCRFIIIAKAPFLNLGDKVVNSRIY